MADLIPAPASLSGYQVNFEMPLLDLSQLSDDEIDGEPILQGTLRLLKYSRSKQLLDKLSEILLYFAHSIPSDRIGDWIEAIGVYVMSVNKHIDSQQYKQTLKSVFPTQYEPGSLADRLLTEGHETGLENGTLLGKIQLLEELLGIPVSQREELLALGSAGMSTRLAELQQLLRNRENRTE